MNNTFMSLTEKEIFEICRKLGKSQSEVQKALWLAQESREEAERILSFYRSLFLQAYLSQAIQLLN